VVEPSVVVPSVVDPLELESVASPIDVDPTVSTPDVDPGGSPLLDVSSPVVPLVGTLVVGAVVAEVSAPNVVDADAVADPPVVPSVPPAGTPSSEQPTTAINHKPMHTRRMTRA
jgi:hypothetical protein